MNIHGHGNADVIHQTLSRIDSSGLANLRDQDYSQFLKEFDDQVVKDEIGKRSNMKTPIRNHSRLVSE